MIKTTNPYSLATKKYKEETQVQIKKRLSNAEKFFLNYRFSSLPSRIKSLKSLKKDLKTNGESYAKVITDEMGKPLVQAKAEITKCIDCCDYYIKNSTGYLEDEEIITENGKNLVSYQPMGPVLLIMPWNFPFWQVFRAAVPALMAGNPVVLKHASAVTKTALNLEKAFSAAYGADSFQSIILAGNKMDPIYASPYIAKINFTGSTSVGAHVASHAGAAIKECVLELGGNDAYLVLPDADIELAVAELMSGRMKNNGQSCIAAKRWIVHTDVYSDFLDKALFALDSLTLGNPKLEKTDIGPLVDKSALKKAKSQLKMLATDEQEIHKWKGKLPKKGYFIAPAIVEVKKKLQKYNDEEIFAPIALLYRGKDEESMLKLANKSKYGLGSGVFTADVEHGTKIARDYLQSGSSAVNKYVASHPALPFGGFKQSGFGRELGPEGIRSFCNIKTIQIDQ